MVAMLQAARSCLELTYTLSETLLALPLHIRMNRIALMQQLVLLAKWLFLRRGDVTSETGTCDELMSRLELLESLCLVHPRVDATLQDLQDPKKTR